MQNHSQILSNQTITRWFYLFLFIHLACWTLVPALVRLNLPLDAIEGTIWGQQLQWGYDKNPFLNGWLTALAIHLGESGWGIYLFSQLSVIACLWSVWQIAKRMLPLSYALLAVLLLEGIQYFNFHAIDFNDNTLELGLWGLGSYFFYRAINGNRYSSWLLTGLSLGLCMMAKYYTAALIAAMALCLLTNRDYRRLLLTSPPYVGLVTFIAICTPHVVWLFSHDFVTVTYMFARAGAAPHWSNHFFFPAQFMWQQIEVLLPVLILLGLLLIGKRTNTSQRFTLKFNDKHFLLYVGLGPLLLTVLLSLVLGTNLRAGWGMPLLSLTTIILVAIMQPSLTASKLYRFIALIVILMATALTTYAISLIDSTDTSTANFPGKEIAASLTQEWRKRFNTPLPYVAGSRWVGGNIAFYSKDHPTVFIEWNPKHAPWIDEKKLREKGALFVWEISANETLPDNIAKQFPTLTQAIVREFNWQRNRHQLAPVKLGVAFLPPASYPAGNGKTMQAGQLRRALTISCLG